MMTTLAFNKLIYSKIKVYLTQAKEPGDQSYCINIWNRADWDKLKKFYM